MATEAHSFVGALPDDLELVSFIWSNRFGHCYECGCPAAYYVPLQSEPVGLLARPVEELAADTERLRCSVCAAMAASDGETIVYLFAEED